MSEFLMYSTIRIGIHKDGREAGSGTGFFFEFGVDGKFLPCIITNKHVVRDADSLELHFTYDDGHGSPQHGRHLVYNWPSTGLILVHPDPEIDICAIPITPLINSLESQGKKAFIIYLTENHIPKDETWNGLDAIEDIIMVGYPNGLWDEHNNLPIMRRGITATHPRFDFDGKPEFVIDAACFPGSSGSPVFIMNSTGYKDRNGNINMGSRMLFLGLLHSGPVQRSQGEIRIVDIPTVQKAITESTVMLNLGYVIKANKILDLKNVFPPFQ